MSERQHGGLRVEAEESGRPGLTNSWPSDLGEGTYPFLGYALVKENTSFIVS